MRLQKFMAEAGVASRRKSEEMIASGLVKINGEVMTSQGYIVSDTDVISVGDKLISSSEKKVYYILNKPKGYVTTVKDQFARPCVIDLVAEEIKERVYPAGRLDYNTEGLLILTNDGDFVNKITHPKNEIEKKYIAVVAGRVTEEEVEKLKKGVVIDGKKTHPAKVFLSEIFKDTSILEVTISEGRNRQVRKMFEAVGHNVVELGRVSIGNLEIGNLKLGQIRKLNPNEVQALINLAQK